MHIQFDSPSYKRLVESIVTREDTLKIKAEEMLECKALARFFYEATGISLVTTIGSVFFLDKRVTLLFGLTTALTALTNSYFTEKSNSKVALIEILIGQTKVLKELALPISSFTLQSQEKASEVADCEEAKA